MDKEIRSLWLAEKVVSSLGARHTSSSRDLAWYWKLDVLDDKTMAAKISYRVPNVLHSHLLGLDKDRTSL